MTETVFKSCEDTIVKLQGLLEQIKVESERTRIAKEELKVLKCEEESHSLDKAMPVLHSVRKKIEEHFEMKKESSVIEIEEKIEKLADKVVHHKLIKLSHWNSQFHHKLSSQNDEIEKCIDIGRGENCSEK